jgi:uncharacterized damage-inducible protein DinB
VLGLVDASAAHSNEWLATKYELVLDALGRALRQLDPLLLERHFVQRRMSVRAHILHIAAFAEAGCDAHERGKFDTDDMFTVTARANRFTDVEEIDSYVAQVRDDIAAFLRTGATEHHDRVVSSHYGGQVSVVELLRIMLRHSTHHLRQLYWFMENELSIEPSGALTTEDRDGITTPDELFATGS